MILKMKKYFPFFFSCFFLLACSNNEQPSIPNSVLPKEQMAQIMVDVHLMEASMNLAMYSPEKIITTKQKLNANIFKKNNISKKQFDDSFDFYSKNQELLTEVYQLVLDNLSKMQAEEMNKK